MRARGTGSVFKRGRVWYIQYSVRGRRFRILLSGRTIEKVSRSYYEEGERGRALAVFGSFDMLEIAIACGRADRRIGAGRGDPVQVSTEPL